MADKRSVYVCPRCKTRILFGTPARRAPARCPDCRKPLRIPTALPPLPPIRVTCPDCSADYSLHGYRAGAPCICPECGAKFTAPGSSPFWF